MRFVRGMVSGMAGWGLLAMLAGASGCAVHRGVDFGSLVGSAEDVQLVRTYSVKKLGGATNVTVLVLPPLGSMPKEDRPSLFQSLLQEAKIYFPARVSGVESDVNIASYISEKNLAPTAGIVDFQEVARVGRLLGMSHVLCTWVRKSRSYPPQDLDLYFVMVETADSSVVCEMDAHFNASEQKVVLAMNDYLQARRAREFNKTNLDIMLRSPAEFRQFAAARALHTMARKLWPGST